MGLARPVPAVYDCQGGSIWAEPNAAGGTVFKLTPPSAKPQELANGQ